MVPTDEEVANGLANGGVDGRGGSAEKPLRVGDEAV